MATPWPPAHEKYLRRLIAQHLGYVAIAHALNACYGTAYTRNSIIGKCARLKIPAPGRERTPMALLALSQRGKRVLPRGYQPPQPARPMSLSGPHVAGIPLMLRQRHQCGWPINDGNPFLFCGMPKDEDGRSYCGWHEWLAMRPSRRQPLPAIV